MENTDGSRRKLSFLGFGKRVSGI
ncbi:hypothetical protein EAI_05737 [Harpegnathos saltator]|uniref:Uncharacterized protein n=1 Tax=Harpegnathos saltator TaxID=610380 RepID=E2C059_HARSA|nr:hypothetical protein EAI_05737 [Harpegnathos saltator]